MLINSLFLAISSSIDSLGIGITYGIKNTKISYIGKIILFIISFLVSIISIWFGNSIISIFPTFLSASIGNILLILMGFFIMFQSLKKDKKDISLASTLTPSKPTLEAEKEQVYHFFIRFLGITIQIIKNPINSDFDNSKLIDAREALFLGLALSLDSFCIGIGGSIIGINISLFPLFISCFQLIFMSIGNWLGRKLHQLSFIPANLWSIISGFLLISIGIIKLVLI